MRLIKILLIALLMALNSLALASGKLIGTPGVSSVEGSGGGGMVPWAVISGYATRDEVGGAAYYSNVSVDDYELNTAGVAVGFRNRLELAYSWHEFEVSATGTTIQQNIYSAKYRLLGDAIFTAIPQISVGVQHKRLVDADTAFAMGAAKDNGTDIYLAATKMWLDGPWHRTALLNATARLTKANQAGTLGFGSVDNNDYELQWEVAAGLFLSRRLAIGVEYRQKPDKLGLREDDWKDIWLAYFFNKRFSITAAYVDLGSIAGASSQSGSYLSMQLAM